MTPREKERLEETLQIIETIGDEMFSDCDGRLNARQYLAATEVYRAMLADQTLRVVREELPKLTYETTFLRNAITGIASQILGALSAKRREPV